MKNLGKTSIFILVILAITFGSCSNRGLQSIKYKTRAHRPKVECEKRVTVSKSGQGYYYFGAK